MDPPVSRLRRPRTAAARARSGTARQASLRARVSAAYTKHGQDIYRYALSIVGNRSDAEDVLQAVMGKAMASSPRDHGNAGLRPWLYRVAHNESISHLRQNSKRTHSALEPDELTASATPSPDGQLERKDRLRALVADLKQLPDRQRAALVMRELSGLDYSEIAAALECSEGAARQSVYEGRAALHARAEGRTMACEEVRELISDGDGRRLRSKLVKAHLANCESCQDFRAGIDARREDLAAIFPPLPAAALGGVLAGTLAGSGGAGGGAAVAVGGSAAGTGPVALGGGGIAAGIAAKSAAIVAAGALGLGGADAAGVIDVRGSDAPQPAKTSGEGTVEGTPTTEISGSDAKPGTQTPGAVQEDGRPGNDRAAERRQNGVQRSGSKGGNGRGEKRSAEARADGGRSGQAKGQGQARSAAGERNANASNRGGNDSAPRRSTPEASNAAPSPPAAQRPPASSGPASRGSNSPSAGPPSATGEGHPASPRGR